MKRRRFMRLLYGGAIGAAVPTTIGLLTGCGSGNSLAVVPGPAAQIGLVNMSEIGGTGLLVQSVYSPAAPVGADGSFISTFSAVGTQLISATDGTGALRGLGLFNPRPLLFSPLRQTAPSTIIDMRATAVALVYITPGILTTDTADGIQRQSEISNLTTFPALLAFLAQNMKSSSLQSILGDSTLDSLKGACIREWAAGHGFPDTPPALGSNDAGGFSANLRSDTDKSPQAHLMNRSWRWINVARVDLDNRKAATGTKDPVFLALAGAAGASWGAIFGSSVDLPATATENPDLGDSGRNAYLEYWIRGPGAPTLPALNSSITSSEGAAEGASALLYVVAPFIDLIFGEVRLLALARSLAQNHGLSPALLEEVTAAAAPEEAMIGALATNDQKALAAAVFRLAMTFIGSAETLLASFGITDAASSNGTSMAAAPLLRSLSAAWTSSNFILAARTWLRYPHVSSFEIKNSSADINITYDVTGVNSIKVEVLINADTVASSLLVSDSISGNITASFDGLQAGDLTVTATAYENSVGTGSTLATVSNSFHTDPGERASVDLRLEGSSTSSTTSGRSSRPART